MKFKNIQALNKTILVSLLAITLAACVPQITTVYPRPTVTGRLVDFPSLQPIIGGSVVNDVFDVNSDDYVEGKQGTARSLEKFIPQKSITTNDGRFELVAEGEMQAILAMPAHALKWYKFRVAADDAVPVVIPVAASMRILRQERIDVSVVPVAKNDWFELMADQVAEMDGGVNLKEFRQSLYPHGSFAKCDAEYGDAVIYYLTVLRLLGNQDSNSNNTDVLANRDGVILSSIHLLENSIEAFINSCNSGQSNLFNKEFAEPVLQEINELRKQLTQE